MAEPAAGLRLRLRQQTPIPLDATLAVAPGELVALIGPSGSGKSTVLRSIAGLYSPTDGEISCDGRIWLDTAHGTDLSPQQRRVGLVFQHYALFPHMTALNNVTAALGHLPRNRRMDRARELLELVGLGELGGRRPGALSGGQQQRVAVARALARNPAVLLLDEPFSAVDQTTRRRLQGELATLRRAVRVPIIMVTHDLEEAAALADRIVVLDRGRTLQEGKPAEVARQPANVAVARLLDLRNVFAGEVIEHRPELGRTLLRWHGRTLMARHQPAFPAGSAVAWLSAPGGLVMADTVGRCTGPRENVLPLVVQEVVTLGDTARITGLLDGEPDVPFTFGVAASAVQERMTVGTQLNVILQPTLVHLMPQEFTL